ncbi:hypothetical protein GCM10010129_70520 [Streptomyces fumigatiscleroticus]|nr:hypothetical protein GCM10010129_70520 [Streptomyces fumigatiscleroticus]
MAAGLAGAGPASAIGSPMADNHCENASTVTSSGPAAGGPGTGLGNLGQVPYSNPFSHCGDMEPLPTEIVGLDIESLLF